MKKALYLLIFIAVFSCYGVNEETTEICGLSICCNEADTWEKIFKEYSIENTDSDSVKDILLEFRNQPFKTDIIHFKEYPEEYIGISENKMQVRYVYNKKIADQVLDGLSPQLSDSEKIRISIRINLLHINYLNDEGRRESIILMRKECNDFLEKKE